MPLNSWGGITLPIARLTNSAVGYLLSTGLKLQVMQTSKQQTSLFGEEDATYCQWGHLASPTAQQENDLANKTNATCGHMVIEQSKRFFPDGSFSRMLPALLIGMTGWYSTRCVLTWKLRGTRSPHRLYFQLQVSTLRTEGIGSGLLPTIQTQGLKQCDQDGQTRFADLRLLPTPRASEADQGPKNREAMIKSGSSWKGQKRGATVSTMAKSGLLPTPNTMDTMQTISLRKDNNLAEGGRHGVSLHHLASHGMLPSPNTNDYRSGMANRTGGTHNQSLNDSIAQQAGTTSQLNPRFVIEMMGLPPDWTELPFLPGAKSPFMQPETP